MYPVSAAYKTAIGQNVRDVRITGTITLKDNSVINITDEDIVQGSLYITEQCVAGEDIEVGNVYASEMGLSLRMPLENPYSLDGARIIINFGINVETDPDKPPIWEYVPLGYFYVTEIQRKANNVNLTALDGMLLFDIPVGDPGSSSPRNFVVHACEQAGVPLGTSVFEIDTFANATLLFAAPDASKIKTCRDLLMWACQIMGAFARMNRQGELEIVPIKARPSVKTISKAERFNSDVSDFAVKITKVSMQVGEAEYSRGTEGMTMVLDENPLMTGLSESQINAVLDNLLAQITTAVYVPFNSNFIGDPALQPGDFVTLSDTSVLGGGDVASIITHSTWRYRGPHNIKGAGKHGLVRGVQNQQMKAVSSIVAIARAAQDLALAANQSTQLIKDAIGGHVLIRQNPDETNEILIMDNPDPDQAVKIWRWNMGGLGYSDNCVGADNPDREYEIAMTMDGAINANFIKTGQLDAGVVRIGPETTFAPGYDPSQIEGASAVGMGVDADCLGLWHFDGSLNSHKGVAAIGDANFDEGCFGQAVKIEEGTTNLVPNPFFDTLTGWNAYTNGAISSVDKIKYGSNACKLSLTANGATRLYTTNTVTLKAGKKYVGSALINTSGGLNINALYILTNIGSGTQGGTLISDVNLGNNLRLISYLFEPAEDKVGNLGILTASGTTGQYMIIDAIQLEEGTTSTPFVEGTRLGVLKAPTTGLPASQGTISFRAKNLSASANGSVLIDLPKSDNTQGIKAGIADDGKIFLSDSDKVSKSYVETTQADFNSGTLTDVTATSAGDLELTGTQYINLFGTTGKGDTLTGWSNDGTLSTNGEWIYNNANSTGGGYLTKAIAGSKYYFLAITAKTSATIAACRLNISQYDNSNNLLNNNTTTFNYTNMSSTAKRLGSKFQSEATAAKLQAVYIVNNSQVLYTKEYALIEITADEYNNLTVDELLAKYPYTTGTATTYKPSGTREKIVDLSGANPAGGTKIEWSKTTPTNTTVKVETALSIDGGSTYGAFTEVTSGQAIPGITSDTDLSNARLKIKETLSTTDTTKTPQLHSLSFTITESAGATVYGPNKSTLTGWDSISLAWKPERLSLVVNDEEACYIENPGLPTALGSHIFIGTDRNGNNAINTLVDELRIDKVYREVNIRTGWYKTGVPFYTSEDMKQWPGYMRLETDGLKVYDSSDALRVLVGSWLKDAVRKYGIKIIDGEIYSSLISTGPEGDDRGAIKIQHVSYPDYPDFNWGSIELIGGSGKKLMVMGIEAQQPSLRFYDETSTDPYYLPAGYLYLATGGSTKEIALFALDRGLSISTLNEYITLGPTAGVQGQRGIGITGFRSDLNPIEDGGANLGQPNRRWWAGYIVYTQTGDLCFSEQTCAICGGRFKSGDVLALLTKAILEDGYTYTIPVHEKCKDIEKTIEVKVPEMTTKYRVNDHGEVEPYKTPAFEEVEEEILRVHPDYELDENTGKFKRKLNDWNRQFYSEEELLNGVYSSERVAKARDTVIRKKPKFRTLSIQVGKPSE